MLRASLLALVLSTCLFGASAAQLRFRAMCIDRMAEIAQARENAVENKIVVFVDDILATGATAQQLERTAMEKWGAQRVYHLALGKVGD